MDEDTFAHESEIESKKKLIVNYIPSCMSQEDVQLMFERIGPVTSCKLVRNHQTGVSLGFAFVEYGLDEHAAQAIAQVNGVKMQEKTLRVSYARKTSPETKNTNVYIAGLPEWVDEGKLAELFAPFGEIVTVKVLVNADNTPRGIGFVRFNYRVDAERAIESMAGKKLPESIVPLTVKLALPPASKNEVAGKLAVRGSARFNPIGATNPLVYQSIQTQPGAPGVSGAATSNTLPPPTAMGYSIYVYGLQPHHTDLNLYEIFSPFGAILNVKMMRDLSKEGHPGKGYAFVNFVKYDEAARAVLAMHNYPYDGKVLQVSFKDTKNKGAGGQAIGSATANAVNASMVMPSVTPPATNPLAYTV